MAEAERVKELVTLDQRLPEIWRDDDACVRALKVCKKMAQAGIGVQWGQNKDIDTLTAELFTKLAFGVDIGLPPSAAMQEVFITDGKPNIGGQMAMGVVEAQGGFAPGTKPKVTFSGEPKTDEWSCTVTTQPRDGKETVETTRTWGEVKQYAKTRKGKDKDAYKAEPEAMLMWRTYGKHCKMYYKAYLGGMVMREDIMDARVMRDVTPRKRPADDPDPALALLTKKAPEPTQEPPDDAIEGEATEVQDDFLPADYGREVE